MDPKHLQSARENNLFTDLILILVDNQNNKIEIPLHRLVLYSSCIYFRKLFENFKEKEAKEITIQNIPDIDVMYDIGYILNGNFFCLFFFKILKKKRQKKLP